MGDLGDASLYPRDVPAGVLGREVRHHRPQAVRDLPVPLPRVLQQRDVHQDLGQGVLDGDAVPLGQGPEVVAHQPLVLLGDLDPALAQALHHSSSHHDSFVLERVGRRGRRLVVLLQSSLGLESLGPRIRARPSVASLPLPLPHQQSDGLDGTHDG